MRCPDEDALLRYLGPAGPGPDAAALEEHFDGCASCRAVVAALARTSLVDRGPPSSSSSSGATSLGGTAAWASDFLPAGVRIGRYVVQGRIGAGAMGVVYDAIDPALRRAVAIKRLRAATADDPARQARLLREARSLARLSHPNVVAVYDAGIHEGHAFLAMARVEGTTLRAWLDAAPRSREAILGAMRGVAAGLAAVHAAGLVHRDLKPDNVLIDAGGRALVTDFGLVALGISAALPTPLATDAGRGPANDSALTQTGQRIGTPRYMAPEQLVGDEVGPRADQFAFCMVLFEALTGRSAFAGASTDELLRAIRARAIDPAIDSLPRGLRALVLRGLEPDPARRYLGMHEVVAGLAPVGRRRRVAAFVAGLGALSVVAVAVMQPSPAVGLREPPAEMPAPAEPGTSAGLFAQGRSEADAGEFVAAMTTLEAAYDAAVAEDAWGTAADAATSLVRVVGVQAEDLDDALRWHRHAEAALRRYGDDATRTAELVDALGAVVLAAGEFERARALFAEGLERSIAVHGPEDPRTATARSHLGAALAHLGQIDEALALHRQALARLDAGQHRVERARVLLALSNAQGEAGHVDQARESLAQAKALLDARDGPLLGRVANNLAIALTRLGEYDAAAAELDAAERLIADAYGVEHPNVANVISGRANLRAIAGDFAGARAAFEQALAIKERALGADHPALLPIIRNLAQIARITGDRSSARRHLDRAAELARARYGPEHLELAALLEDLGNTLATGEAPAEAMPVLEEAMAIRRRRVGPDDPSLANNWLAQAKVHIEAEDWVSTDAALDRAEAIAPSAAHRSAIVFTRAESRWRRGDARVAKRLAREARALILDRPDQAGLLATIDGWLAAH